MKSIEAQNTTLCQDNGIIKHHIVLMKVQNLICHDHEMAIVQALCIVIVFAILKPNKNVFDVAKFYIP
jgi:hypothetical protein